MTYDNNDNGKMLISWADLAIYDLVQTMKHALTLAVLLGGLALAGCTNNGPNGTNMENFDPQAAEVSFQIEGMT